MRLRSVAALMLLGALAGAQQPTGIIVKPKPGYAPAMGLFRALVGAREVERLPLGETVLALPPGISAESVARIYASSPAIEFAEPNYTFKAFYLPNDPYFSAQYALGMISCPKAWDATVGSPSVTIAIVDTGIDPTHPDLAGKVVAGWDFVNDDPYADDDNGHGTHVAGIAGASSNNGVGIAGVAQRSALMPIKVLDASGSGLLSDVASGIVWAVDRGANVISLSLGSSSDSQTLRDAVAYATSNGAVVVAAAGNAGSNVATYPAAIPEVLSVGSVSSSDGRSAFSNYGSWVDVAAPGESILSTVPGGYEYWSGTSMACPQVSGIAALVYSRFGLGIGPAQVVQRIQSSADPVGSWLKYGRVNAASAVGANPPALAELSLSPTSIVSGAASKGVVSLTGPAGSGGALVALKTLTAGRITIPASVMVAPGKSSASFGITSSSSGPAAKVVLMGTYGGRSKSAVLSLSEAPLTLASLEALPSRARPGSVVELRATLSRAAGSTGARVSFSSSNSLYARIPAAIVAPPGAKSVSARVQISRLAGTGQIVFRATAGNATLARSVTIATN